MPTKDYSNLPVTLSLNKKYASSPFNDAGIFGMVLMMATIDFVVDSIPAYEIYSATKRFSFDRQRSLYLPTK